MLAYLDGFWQNSCCLHNSANVISGESPLGWRSPKLLFLDFLFPLSSYFPRIVSAAFCGSDIGGLVPRRPFSTTGLSSYLAPLERLLRPRVHHIVYYPECYSGISAVPSRPLGLNADVAHAASIDSSFPPTFFLKLSY